MRHEANEGILNTALNKRYPTTLSAFLEADRFNDLVGYTDLTLGAVPSRSLEQLYMDRFEQLRRENDYLELWWGGGYDSTYILYISLQMEMPFDAITMYCRGDPRKYGKDLNYELAENYRHVYNYNTTFDDRVRINYLDVDHMWKLTRDRHHDYKKWCYSSYGMWEDVARISADDVLADRNHQQGTIVTGKGYGGVVYNKQYDRWSYYTECLNINYPGATSYKLPVTRFYNTPEIIRATAERSRQWFLDNRPEFKDLWVTTESWDHEHVRHRELQGQIKHFGKGDWQTLPKFKYWVDDKTDRERYPEYWDFVDWLEREISAEMFVDDTGFMGKGLKQIRPHMINF